MYYSLVVSVELSFSSVSGTYITFVNNVLVICLISFLSLILHEPTSKMLSLIGVNSQNNVLKQAIWHEVSGGQIQLGQILVPMYNCKLVTELLSCIRLVVCSTQLSQLILFNMESPCPSSTFHPINALAVSSILIFIFVLFIFSNKKYKIKDNYNGTF